MPALVIEGGANRASYATGVVDALQQAGFVPDAVYGTSAGGALAAWFGAGQTDLAARSWDAVLDRRLLSYRRALVGRPVLDLRLLYRHYYPNVFGMDVERLRRAAFPVHVCAASVDTGETVYPDIRHKAEPLAWVHAGAAIPIFAECPVEVEGRRYLDGGATDPIPVQRAIDDGHKDIVVVMNRAPGERKPEPSWATAALTRRFPRLAEPIRLHHELHNRAVRLALDPPEGVRVRVVRPATDTGVSRTTRDLARIHAAIARGRADGARMAGELGLTHVKRLPVRAQAQAQGHEQGQAQGQAQARGR